MSVGTLVPLAEYLSTSYDPDVEYVDGTLVERNGGDRFHSLIQSNLIFALRRKYPHLFVLPEMRSRTTETRYRLPDVCVLHQFPETKYLLDAAWIAIEILSEDDRMMQVMAKLAEYEQAGVSHVWLIDPQLNQLSVYSRGNLTAVDAFTTPEGVTLTPEEVFAR